MREYDESLSERFGIPQSIKITSIKPSGTVSLCNKYEHNIVYLILAVAGATPGLHFPESRFYIRRIRLSSTSELIPPLKQAGYSIFDAVNDEKKQTVVVEIPVDVGNNVRTLERVSMWEQLQLAAFLQAYWADNQVSSHLASEIIIDFD